MTLSGVFLNGSAPAWVLLAAGAPAAVAALQAQAAPTLAAALALPLAAPLDPQEPITPWQPWRSRLAPTAQPPPWCPCRAIPAIPSAMAATGPRRWEPGASPPWCWSITISWRVVCRRRSVPCYASGRCPVWDWCTGAATGPRSAALATVCTGWEPSPLCLTRMMPWRCAWPPGQAGRLCGRDCRSRNPRSGLLDRGLGPESIGQSGQSFAQITAGGAAAEAAWWFQRQNAEDRCHIRA